MTCVEHETRRCLFLEHESHESHETRRSPTDRRRSNITDGHGFFRMRRVVCMGKCPMTGLLGMRSNGHAPKGQKRIAQGKRSDTLGKPPHHITPRPVRVKAYLTPSVSTLLPLQGASYTATLYPGCRFACPGLCATLGFQPALAIQHCETCDMWNHLIET